MLLKELVKELMKINKMKLRIVKIDTIHPTSGEIKQTLFYPQVKTKLFWCMIRKTYEEVETTEGNKIRYTKHPYAGFANTLCVQVTLEGAEQELSNFLKQYGKKLDIKYIEKQKVYQYSVKNDKLVREEN
jgi:hypothetical protein